MNARVVHFYFPRIGILFNPIDNKFGIKLILYISFILLYYSLTAFGAELVSTAAEIVQKATNECAEIDDGKFNAAELAITLHDFTGDGQPEEIVDASRFSCSTAVSLWGGSGGTYLWVIVDGKTYEFLAHKWQVVDVDDQKVLLLAVHSSECSDLIGPCYRALVWGNGFRTTRKSPNLSKSSRLSVVTSSPHIVIPYAKFYTMR